MSDTVRLYVGKDIDVTYDTERCIHAAECTSGLPEVFNNSRRPWIAPNEAAADAPIGDPISTDWSAVRRMRTNPRTSDHVAGSPIRLAQEEFNRSYCALLQRLELAFNGAPQTLGSAIGAMYTLKAQAQELMQIPTEDKLETVGPTFEYVAPDRRKAASRSIGETHIG